MSQLELTFLGPLRARFTDQPLLHLRSSRVQNLLAYLVLEAAQPHARPSLATLFWPDEPEPVAKQNLRQTLYELRQLLDQPEGSAASFFLVTRETVQFNPASAYTLDVTRFREHWQQGHWQAAVELYQGELLTGLSSGSSLFEEWFLLQREQLHIQVMDALDHLLQQALAQTDYSTVQRVAHRQLTLEPWREATQRHLIYALAASGDRTAALAQYQTCRKVLAEELGVEPDAETVALVEQIRHGEIDKQATSQEDKEIDRQSAVSPALLVSQSPSLVVSDWGAAPDITTLHGRDDEQAELTRWLVQNGCRIVAVLGMGGMGKTALTTYLSRQLATRFEVVIWRSLLNAPPLGDILQEWLRLLAGADAAKLPDSLDGQLAMLFGHLRQRRSLLILDNAESIMQGGERAGYYRSGYESYGQLFKRLGENQHQSCLLITSREQPQEVARLTRETPLVRALPLRGLPLAAGQAILRTQGMTSSAHEAGQLIQRYSGNPLALMLIAETIQELFDGDVATFLQADAPIFDDIRDVLDQQYARLAPLERALLLTLAIERQPLSESDLEQALAHTDAKRHILEALRSLQRRSLLESYGQEQGGVAFGLQNVITEYLTDVLITRVCREVENETPALLHSHPLLKVRAQEYIRQSQQRIFLQPIGKRLLGTLGPAGLQSRCQRLLERARQERPLQPSFLAGNLLNLLINLGADLQGYDFSNLCIWQAYLQGASLSGVNFANADLAHSTFTDTFAAIYTLAYSPDGALLAAGTANGGIRLWQSADGQPWAAMQDPAGTVYSVAFSPDSHTLVSAGGDEHVRLWHVPTQQLLATLDGPTNLIWSVACSPNGTWLAAGDFDGNVIIWDAQTRQVIHILPGHTAWVRKVLFTPDSTQVISASRDGNVNVWDIATGALCRSWRAHEGWVLTAAVSPDGKLLVTGSSDRTARLWDLASGSLLTTLTGHSEWVVGVAFHPQGQLLATGSRDLQLRFWDVASRQTINTLQGHSDFLHTLAFAPDGETLASGGDDQTVRLWQTRSGHALQTLQGYTFWMRAIAFGAAPHPSPLPMREGAVMAHETAPPLTRGRLGEGRQIFVYAGIDHIIYLHWLGADQTLLIDPDEGCQELRGHRLLIIALAFSPDGHYLVSGSADQTVRIWPLPAESAADSPAPAQVLTGHTQIVSAVAFSPDGELVASGGEDRTVRLWERQSGQVRFVLHGHNGGVNRVVFHPDGHWLASGSGDRTIRLWDVQSGECVARFDHDEYNRELGLVRSIAFSSDGAYLASTGDDCLVRLWEVASGQPLQALRGHEKYVTAVVFSPDGTLLASAGADQTVRVWDVSTALNPGVTAGQQRFCLRGHHSVIYGLAFSPDGQLLASNSVDETIRFWRVATGECVQVLRMHGPYKGMNISGVTGISSAQKAALKALGAIEVS